MIPTFNEDSTLVITDGPAIPWDVENNRPVDYEYNAGRMWEALKAEHGIDAPLPYAPPVVVKTFLARDFFSLLTVDDFAVIRAATAADDALGLLWASLQAQGDAPISTESPRFLAGWVGLKAAIGPDRAAVIADTLGIPNN